MVYGIPTQQLMRITDTLAHIVLVQNGSGVSIQPHSISRLLTAPCGWNICLITRSDTNCGTAIEITKHVRQKALQCVSLRLITIARMSPRKLQRKVANTAQQIVHPSTLQNILPSLPPSPSTCPNEAKPVQSNNTR